MIVARENETERIFQKNLQLLTPWLREAVSKLDEKELLNKVKIEYNFEGYPICYYHQDNNWIQITSVRPLEEAEQWRKSLSQLETGAIFLYGSGFGYSLFEIFAHKSPQTIVVLFEQDIYIFAAMLHYFDLEPIINTQKIAILVGDSENFAGVFDMLFLNTIFAGCANPSYAFSFMALRNFKAQYMKIHKYIFSQLMLLIFYIGNDHLDIMVGLDNLLSNIGDVVENPYISCLENKYKNVPAFIIANGPSLDKNIQQLKKINNKGLIISTESAIIPLMKNDIKPDILTIVERTKYTYTYHFENIAYPSDIALLCLGLVDKHVYPSFPGQRIPIFRTGEAINQWLNKYLGDGSALSAGANVSHLAFELAVYMGADPIVFVGQDYAYGPEGVTHSKDAVYLQEKGKRARDILKSKPVVYVEGNDGTKIASNQLWADFRHGLEQKIASHPDKTIFNSTEGGARIKGTTCRPLESVIEEYCSRPLYCRVNDIIAKNKAMLSFKERKEGLKKLKESAKEYSVLFRKLVHEASNGKRICNEMIRLQEEGRVKDHKIFEEAYLQNINSFQSFISDELCISFSQQVSFAYFYLMSRLGVIDSPDKIASIFKLQHEFFYYLCIVFQSISIYMEDTVDYLETYINKNEQNEAKGLNI